MGVLGPGRFRMQSEYMKKYVVYAAGGIYVALGRFRKTSYLKCLLWLPPFHPDKEYRPDIS